MKSQIWQLPVHYVENPLQFLGWAIKRAIPTISQTLRGSFTMCFRMPEQRCSVTPLWKDTLILLPSLKELIRWETSPSFVPSCTDSPLVGFLTHSAPHHLVPLHNHAAQFVGLVIDNANQDELSDSRVRAWVQQLAEEGFLDQTTVPHESAPAVGSVTSSPVSSSETPHHSPPSVSVSSSTKPWHDYTKPSVVKSPFSSAEGEFKAFHSSLIKQTLWISTKDPRNSFYTFAKGSKDKEWPDHKQTKSCIHFYCEPRWVISTWSMWL